jgi:GDP-4-dehydro-6-deoxy-D-mannose reductase
MTRGGEEPLQSARVLITGAHGFVGRHLIRALENQRPGWTLIAPESLTQAGLDISQAHSVNACIAAATPDIVVHLAGVAAVTSATNDPRHAWAVNAGGVLNLLLAIDQFAPQAKLLHVSTAEVYGASLATGEPTSETAVLRPTNAYAATKAAGDILAGQFARNGRPTVIARPWQYCPGSQI